MHTARERRVMGQYDDQRLRHAGEANEVTKSHRILVFAIAAFMVLMSSSAMVSASEPSITEAPDKKSFNTIPFAPSPSDTQRRELEGVVDLCMKTVEREVPGGHFSANVTGGIVNTVGIDRERFKFWKCMSGNGHPLAPINK